MSVDDPQRFGQAGAARFFLRQKEEIRDALESETDEPLPPEAEAAADFDADEATPVTPQGRRRDF